MNEWRIAKYIRLSQADRDLKTNELKNESDSIAYQRNLIENYISGQPDLMYCEQTEFYDDGYSGTNFARPGFERMIEKIQRREVNCVIVKDFSRFGRDYIELGDYLERIFPILRVRFISVNDHYDSLNYKGTTGGMDVVMKNIVYTYYSRDLSTKVRTAKRIKMKRGELGNGMAPYGYLPEPGNTCHLVIDPVASKIVREIYDESLAGKKPEEIAQMLNDRKVPTPAFHFHKVFPESGIFKKATENDVWNGVRVKAILTRKAYYGAVENHKRERVSVASKSFVTVPEDEHIIVEGMHEPIVTKEEYLEVQKQFRKTGRRPVAVGNYPLFKKVKCGTCGRSCRRDVRNPTRNPHMTFFCNYARNQKRENACTHDVINEDTLHQIIWEQLRRIIRLTDVHNDRITDGLTKADMERETLEEYMGKVKKLIQKTESERMALMERYLMKQISRDQFQDEKKMLDDRLDAYEQEAQALKDRLAALNEWQNVQVPEDYTKIRKCAEAKGFTKELADLVLDKVIFYDKNHIDIYWKFTDRFLEMIGWDEVLSKV